MRHRKRVKKLGRTASHRHAVMTDLVTALIDKERIQTTDSLAKESRKVVERLISKAKSGTLHSRRQVLKIIRDKKIVAKLFDTIAPRYADRNGGYVRLIRVGNRPGDGASVSLVELVGSELAVEEPKKKKKRKKTAEETVGPPPEPTEIEAPKEEGSTSEEEDSDRQHTGASPENGPGTDSRSAKPGQGGKSKEERPHK